MSEPVVNSHSCQFTDHETGTYDHMIEVSLPSHMKDYKAKVGGHPSTICIDPCLMHELEFLWGLGITTTGCCCGHNRSEGYIGVIDSDIPVMKKYGYQVATNPNRPEAEDSFIPRFLQPGSVLLPDDWEYDPLEDPTFRTHPLHPCNPDYGQ